jgi:membrane protein YqaA with SNARE-associated domain
MSGTVISTLLSTLLLSALSAFVPVTPIEPYLVVLATAGHQPAVPLSLAAALGQTAGKALIFAATRATIRSGRVRRWASKLAGRYTRSPARQPGNDASGGGRNYLGRFRRASQRLVARLDRPGLVVPTVLVSSITGVPPLLAVAVHAARTRISAPVFAACCLTGRTIRFLVITLVPGLW